MKSILFKLVYIMAALLFALSPVLAPSANTGRNLALHFKQANQKGGGECFFSYYFILPYHNYFSMVIIMKA